MHDVAVAFDEEAVGDAHVRAALAGGAGGVETLLAQHGDAADIVAAEVQQHQVLGPFLGIGLELFLQGGVLLRRGAAGAGAGDGADGDLAVAQAHQDLGARTDELEAGEVQVEQEGRGVRAPQGTVEGEGIVGERRAEAMAGHHLEDIAGADVVLGPVHDGPVVLPADR